MVTLHEGHRKGQKHTASRSRVDWLDALYSNKPAKASAKG